MRARCLAARQSRVVATAHRRPPGLVKRALLGGGLLALLGAAPLPPVELILRGGTVFTGSGAPFTGDVAIVGDRIRAVSPRLNLPAARVIDVRGMIVAPGFIDPHTHVDDDLTSDAAERRLVPAFLLQGVTTAFIGNDGNGVPDVAATLARATLRPTGINYATWVGFGAIRGRIVGQDDRAPTASELAAMNALVARAMCAGALGLSTGLFYAPQSYAKTDEVIELARTAAAHGGAYDSHIRDESSYSIGLEAAIDEALAIGRAARLPVHIAHIKALGVDVEGSAPRIVARIAAARRAGQRVTADQYPWEASSTSLVAALMPRWAQDGGRAAMLTRLDLPRLRADMTENLRRRGGATKLLITQGALAGRTLADVAAGGDPVAAAIAIVRTSDPDVVSFNQSARDIATFMRQPWVMTGSDASSGHPRRYGSFARKYDEYVVRQRVLSLRQFIERSSTLTARSFGVRDRGELRAGAFADIVVFDPARFAARATYAEPMLTATGVRHVVVNGVLAVEAGRLTGNAAGRALPKRPAPASCPA